MIARHDRYGIVGQVKGYLPSHAGIRIYLGVDTIIGTLSRVVELGSEILYLETTK